ncbi:hypothetical protein PPSIR1_21444 [Plesiocystis pacifica SIR-1]|uniref:Carrier domain-containing protein n=1 Tax=Plesiocystis pacifica SIR-1 TaxID=391625 RepID=A6G3M8_9BACT|nr:phosphopantetheine-binding protein [Plesiocystis pacifica]EDM79635.1 hypothetical protein PPSIR1_21444 [Plesiocystis pacifica SIR-1]
MREKILEVLTTIFDDRDADFAAIGDDDDLAELLGWDSVDVVDLVLEMERRWQVRLADDLPDVVTLALLVERAERVANKK